MPALLRARRELELKTRLDLGRVARRNMRAMSEPTRYWKAAVKKSRWTYLPRTREAITRPETARPRETAKLVGRREEKTSRKAAAPPRIATSAKGMARAS